MVKYHDEAEADFQETYSLNLDEEIEKGHFPRVARLFMQLPHHSRTFISINPASDWDWDKETQSRILAKLDILSVQLGNLFRKKGGDKLKPEPQWQPEYVKIAKEEAEAKQKAENSFSKEDMEHIKAFWKARTHIKMIGEK